MKAFEAEVDMHFITDAERLGRQEGIKEGIEQGMQQGELVLLKEILEEKFGVISNECENLLKQADEASIRSMARAVIKAKTLAEVLATFQKH